jgi:molybdenum cofactor cytidylyltransferase
MNLVQALRVTPGEAVALIGSGGKTTAIFQLAQQLPLPVIVSVTTHLGIHQARFADRHVIVHSIEDLIAFKKLISPSVILVTGAQTQEDRFTGLSADLMDALFNITKERSIPLLIEADGARQKPLKAPAEYEPVIPQFVSLVVLVAGLSGLGKPLAPEWVHRPERFAEISGIRPGEIINSLALERVLTSPNGGLKEVPRNCRRIVLLNQADSLETQAQAQRMASYLLKYFSAVCVASLETPHESQAENSPGGFRIPTIYAVHERIAGVVLAGGGAKRFGRSKQILTWRGKSFVEQAVTTALAAGLSPVILVTGAYHDQVVSCLNNETIRVIHNLDWESGQSSSVKSGVNALPAETGGAVFLLVDQPHISDTLIRALVELHRSTMAPIIAPIVRGQRANPVLFDRVTFPDFANLQGDQGGRALFSRYPVSWLEWQDESILLDVDSPEDYQNLLELE